VFDAIVIGAPDERWGQRVAAIIQPRADRHPSLEDIQLHCRNAIAGYKVPRQLHVVETIVRSPSGKPDYRWAKDVAMETTPASPPSTHSRHRK
jgi:acyl-CoA synthetase (AMP-forming)/AMP-acid ligase II